MQNYRSIKTAYNQVLGENLTEGNLFKNIRKPSSSTVLQLSDLDYDPEASEGEKIEIKEKPKFSTEDDSDVIEIINDKEDNEATEPQEPNQDTEDNYYNPNEKSENDEYIESEESEDSTDTEPEIDTSTNDEREEEAQDEEPEEDDNEPEDDELNNSDDTSLSDLETHQFTVVAPSQDNFFDPEDYEYFISGVKNVLDLNMHQIIELISLYIKSPFNSQFNNLKSIYKNFEDNVEIMSRDFKEREKQYPADWIRENILHLYEEFGKDSDDIFKSLNIDDIPYTENLFEKYISDISNVFERIPLRRN